MHNKNNNKTQTYIQGLRPFSNSIPKTLKKHLRKGSYNYSNIVDNWTSIVNKYISDACYPVSVKMKKGYNCICNIALKIIENKINKRDKILPKIKNLNSVEKKIKHIDNEQLKISLKNFLKAYNKKND